MPGTILKEMYDENLRKINIIYGEEKRLICKIGLKITEEQIENRDKHIEREKNKIIKEFKIAEFIFEN